MIQQIITHPRTGAALRLEYDFDDQTTTISPLEIGEEIVQRDGVTHDVLLRHPAPRPDGFYVAVMPVREFGQPAFVQRYDWETLQKDLEVEIPFDKFGLMAMGLTDDCALAFCDRCFDNPEGGVENSAALLRLQTGEIEQMLGPMISSVITPTFDDDGTQLALIHLDQGGGEVRLYDVADPSDYREFGHSQLPTDFYAGCVAFTDDTIMAWTATTWSFEGELGVYDRQSLEQRSVAELPAPAEAEAGFDPGELEFLISNTELQLCVTDDTAWCGGVGTVHEVDLSTGDVTSHDVDVEGAVVQLYRANDTLLGITHLGELFTTS